MYLKEFLNLRIGDTICETIGDILTYSQVVFIQKTKCSFHLGLVKIINIETIFFFFENCDNKYSFQKIKNLKKCTYVPPTAQEIEQLAKMFESKDIQKTDEEIIYEFNINNKKLTRKEMMKKYHPDKHFAREELYTKLFQKIKKK